MLKKNGNANVEFLRGKVPTFPSKLNPLSAEFSCHASQQCASPLHTHLPFEWKHRNRIQLIRFEVSGVWSWALG